MADWDISSPDDSGIVSQFPANERAARAAVMANFGVEHHETNDANIGKHERITLLDQGADPTIPAGQVGIYNVGGVLRTRSGAGTPVAADAFPADTRLYFPQASVPTGWVQDTSLNDRMLRVVSGAGGGVGGGWPITGMSVAGHAISQNEMPSHRHFVFKNAEIFVAGASGVSLSSGQPAASKTNTGGEPSAFITGASGEADVGLSSATGGSAAHTHGISHNGSWRPAYKDGVIGIKQ